MFTLYEMHKTCIFIVITVQNVKKAEVCSAQYTTHNLEIICKFENDASIQKIVMRLVLVNRLSVILKKGKVFKIFDILSCTKTL